MTPLNRAPHRLSRAEVLQLRENLRGCFPVDRVFLLTSGPPSTNAAQWRWNRIPSSAATPQGSFSRLSRMWSVPVRTNRWFRASRSC